MSCDYRIALPLLLCLYLLSLTSFVSIMVTPLTVATHLLGSLHSITVEAIASLRDNPLLLSVWFIIAFTWLSPCIVWGLGAPMPWRGPPAEVFYEFLIESARTLLLKAGVILSLSSSTLLSDTSLSTTDFVSMSSSEDLLPELNILLFPFPGPIGYLESIRLVVGGLPAEFCWTAAKA